MNSYKENGTWVLVPSDGKILYNQTENIYTCKWYSLKGSSVKLTDFVEVDEQMIVRTDSELMADFNDDILSMVKIVRGTKNMTSTKVRYEIKVVLTDTTTPIHIVETYS